MFPRYWSFNPHTHEGCDFLSLKLTLPPTVFQSTHPRRVWPLSVANLLHVCSSFNPHTHEGCDTTTKVTDGNMQVSIHTPTKGVTFKSDATDFPIPVSIHTPTKGVTDLCGNLSRTLGFQSTHPRRVWHTLSSYLGLDFYVSIHTPTKGVTIMQEQNRFNAEVSIHTPTKGVTVMIPIKSLSVVFQSTHPRRVWQIPIIIP